MENLTIFTLIGCGFCADLKSKLDSKSIKYIEISCSGNRDYICDKNESLLDNKIYPYCRVDSMNMTIYICFTTDSTKLGVIDKISNNKVIYYVDSTINMLNTILKL